jgi:hypothetical protein
VSWVSQWADPNRSHPRGTSATQELPESIVGWFFRQLAKKRSMLSKVKASSSLRISNGFLIHI